MRGHRISVRTPDHRAHLGRWREHDLAEEVWREIDGAAQKNNKVLPPGFFIQEILAARRVAIAIGNRGKLREYYRDGADQMQRIARFLRKSHPYGMPSYPHTQKLAQMLDEAAGYYRIQVELRRNVRGVLRFSQKSKPQMIFMSIVSNELKDITGHWFDKEVAILADIAFDSPEPTEPEAVRWARGRGTGPVLGKRRR